MSDKQEWVGGKLITKYITNENYNYGIWQIINGVGGIEKTGF